MIEENKLNIQNKPISRVSISQQEKMKLEDELQKILDSNLKSYAYFDEETGKVYKAIDVFDDSFINSSEYKYLIYKTISEYDHSDEQIKSQHLLDSVQDRLEILMKDKIKKDSIEKNILSDDDYLEIFYNSKRITTPEGGFFVDDKGNKLNQIPIESPNSAMLPTEPQEIVKFLKELNFKVTNK